jgi:peroxidase
LDQHLLVSLSENFFFFDNDFFFIIDILAVQFDELKKGDRFYYENDFNPVTHFNEQQMNEIRKMTIAKLVCDNLDVNQIQRNPFYVADELTNPLVDCANLPNIDFTVFKDY